MVRINGSDLMFTDQDIEATTEVLPRLIRMIFVKLGITNDDYLSKYRAYYKEKYPDRSAKEFAQMAAADRKIILYEKSLFRSVFLRVIEAMGYTVIEYTHPLPSAKIVIAEGDHRMAPHRHPEMHQHFSYASPDGLRDAAIRMQVAVAKILENGGLNIPLWWDDLVEAQSHLASQTKGTQEEYKKFRKE